MIRSAAPRSRVVVLGGLLAPALILGAVLTPVGPAAANVDTFIALQNELSAAGTEPIIVLTDDLDDTSVTLLVERDVEVDLNGQSLTSGSVVLSAGVTLTIDDSSEPSIGAWSALPSTSNRAGFQITGAALTINGGDIEARGSGGSGGAGIGGVLNGDGGTLTVNGGTVLAVASIGAGVGGGQNAEGGTTTVTGGYLEARGESGAGIGGSRIGSSSPVSLIGAGGTTTITGGEVVAVGDGLGAGIGGSSQAPGGVTVITGGTVTATGGASGSPGIGGGGAYGAGATVTISAAGEDRPVVTASSAGTGVGIGGGAVSFFGEPVNPSGTLSLGSASLSGGPLATVVTVETDAQVELGAAGGIQVAGPFSNLGDIELVGVLDIPTGFSVLNQGRIDGSGTVQGEGELINQGSICAIVDDEATNPLPDDDSGLTVTGNAYYLPYQYPEGFSVGNNVYADTFESGCRDLPDVSRPSTTGGPPLINVGWTLTEDGSGPFLTTTESLAAAVTTNPGTLYPTLIEAELEVTATPSTATAGETVEVAVSGPWPRSNATSIDLTDRAVFSEEGQTAGDQPGELIFTDSGQKLVTATVDYSVESDLVPVSGDVEILVTPADLAGLTVVPSATEVEEGDSIELAVNGRDAFGNVIDIDPSTIVVTSSVPTDIINGLTVTFPTASPHVLTVTAGEFSAQVTIEVTPAATDLELSDTGAADTAVGFGLAALLIGLGLGVITLRRRLV